MAHFAELDENNIVKRVIVINNEDILDENGQESEQIGIQLCNDMLGGTWVQTSYNHNFRGRYAGIGWWYDQENDMFVDILSYRHYLE